MRDWSFLGLRIVLLFGPWYVPNVMLLRCKTRHAERISSKCSHVFAKLLHWRVLVKKGRALAAARNAPPVPVTEQIVQEIKSLYPADPEPPAPVSAPVSALFLSEVAEHVPTTLRKMPRLSEPGPLGMHAEHWYDFGSLAGNSDLFVQVIAHKAAAAVPSSVSQYFKAGQITPTTPYDVISPQTCAEISDGSKERISGQVRGTIAVRYGRPDWANTMIKTIQYLAEADNSRVLVALDLKAAFQNVSRRAMLYSIAQTDADLAAVFSKWYTGTTEHRMHYDSAYNKISANSGVDQGCPLSACGFSAVVDPVLRSVMAQLCTHYDTGAKLFAYLDDGYLWIKPQCLLQTIAVITTATRSVNLALQSTKTQVWKGSCLDPIPPEFQHKVTLTLSCLGGHLQIHGDTEPSRVVLGEQATMEKTTQRFQKIATTLADLNDEGLNVQTVNDLLTMYVGAASQHVLRMSFVPEQEAQNFDRQVITYWSRLMHRDIASPLFFSTSQAWWTWGGICGSTSCGCPMACVAVDHSYIDGNNPISGHRFTFQFNTTTSCPTRSTPIHPLPTNE